MSSLFYENFQQLCRKKGLSMSAAVNIMGFSKGNLTYWRQGNLPKGDVLRRMAHFFNVPVDTLVGYTYDPVAAQREELLRLFTQLTAQQREEILTTLREKTEHAKGTL